MIESPIGPTFDASLPPLGGGLLLLYRAVWLVLASAAVAALVWSASDAPIAITALRLMKCVVVIAVTALLARRRQRDPVAAILSLALLLWAVSSSVEFSTSGLLFQLLDRVRFFLFALALLLFPDGVWRPQWAKAVAYVSGGACLVGILELIGILPTHAYWPSAIGCILAAIYAMIEQYRLALTDGHRQQLKWVALGLVVGVGLILSARGGAAVALRMRGMPPMTILWEAMFQLGIVAISCGFLVSLLKYRLYDAETAISRSTTLAGLTIVLVAAFAATEAAVEGVGQLYFNTSIGNVSSTMAAAVVAVLLSPVHERISAWTERRFQKDLVALKEELPEKLTYLAMSHEPSAVGVEALKQINRAVQASRSAMVMDGRLIAAVGVRATDVRSDQRQLLPTEIPLPGGIGLGDIRLLVGSRPDGSKIGAQDLEAIKRVWPDVRRALAQANAGEFERAHARRHRVAINRAIAGIQTKLAEFERSANHRARD
jgi:hypothetical protein